MPRLGWRRGFLLSALLLVVSCAPRPSDDPGGARNSAGAAPSQPKLLRLGLVAQYEPRAGFILFATGGTGFPQHNFLVHAGLTRYDEGENVQPWIATSVPNVAAGDWYVFPDGRMDVTWKLRPGVQWHDGTPLSAEDFVFGLDLLQDRALPAARPASLGLISGIDAPDEGTLVVHWKQPYFLANAGVLTTQPALPRHILGEIHDRGDAQALINSPYFNTDFVGLGPYRVGEWTLGSQMELTAFDGYFEGRPKIDRIIVKYYGAENLAIAVERGQLHQIGRAHV